MIETETLPRDLEAEVYCLACMVIWPDCADEVFALVSRNDFTDPLHRDIVACFEEQHRDGGIDLKLARQRLELPHSTYGDLSKDYFDDLADTASTRAFIPFEAAKLVEVRRKRDRYDHFQTLAEHSLNGWTAEQLDRENESALYDWKREREATATPDYFSLSDLRKLNPSLNEPIVDGLLRRGETCNIIADSKVGKSWLGYGLGWAIITGAHWLGRFATQPGKVLLIDNELHRCTLANRIPAVARAMGINPDLYGDDFVIRPMRGRLASLADIATDLEEIEPAEFSLILMDAKYRFIASGVSENDNGAETQFYNTIDQIAEHTQSAVALIHHSSKGDQSGKKVTDVGSGAGAQSRATDCHLIVRPHEDEGVAVIEAAVRSFAPVDPLPVRWEFPLWHPAFGVDPTKLKGRQTAREQKQATEDIAGMDRTELALQSSPAGFNELCRRTGFGKDKQRRLVNKLCADGKVQFSETNSEGQKCHFYTLNISAD